MEFKLKVADTVFDVVTQHDLTAKLVKDYLCYDEAETTIKLTQDDIDFEKTIEEKKSPEYRTRDDYLEFIALERKVTEYLIEKDIYLIHGVLLSKDGVGYLFIAPSGTGKSTHAANWVKVFRDRVEIVNGDKPFVTIQDGVAYAYGTPWCGKEFLNINKKVPLGNIIELTRGKRNHIKSVSLNDIYPVLYQQTYKPKNKLKLASTLNFLEKLDEAVSFHYIGCNMEKESAAIAYRGIATILSFEDILDIDDKLTYTTKGTSMRPLLTQDKDLSVLEKIHKYDELEINDVLLYKRDNGQYVLHRLIKKKRNGTFVFLGDNLYKLERGIRRDQILARLIGINKGRGNYIPLINNKIYDKYVFKLTANRLNRRFKLFRKAKYAALKKKINEIKKKKAAKKKSNKK